MILTVVDATKTTDVVKRAFFLAYQACGGAVGLGVLQDRGGVTEEHVWGNVLTRGDYPTLPGQTENPSRPYGDYVFGRMMKMGCKFTNSTGEIEISDSKPRGDYQAWCGKYPSHETLFVAAANSLGVQLKDRPAPPAVEPQTVAETPLPPPPALSQAEIQKLLRKHPLEISPLKLN